MYESELTRMDELKQLSKPLIEFLKDNYNMHTKIEISDSCIKVIEDVVCITG